MRISVVGCGYLGAVHASAMAELGHEVVGIDVDERKIGALAAGRPPFYEPGLPEILTSATPSSARAPGPWAPPVGSQRSSPMRRRTRASRGIPSSSERASR